MIGWFSALMFHGSVGLGSKIARLHSAAQQFGGSTPTGTDGASAGEDPRCLATSTLLKIWDIIYIYFYLNIFIYIYMG